MKLRKKKKKETMQNIEISDYKWLVTSVLNKEKFLKRSSFGASEII